MENFATLHEILVMYCISWKLVRDILRHNKIEFCKRDEEIYINQKEFYQIYTSKYNPALFSIEEKKSTIEDSLNKNFFNFFSEPVDCKQSLRKMVMTYAE